MTNFREKYGPAARGLDLILIARRPEPLAEITRDLTQKFGVNVFPLTIDLAAENATEKIITAIGEKPVDLFVYNAAASHIGPFLAADPAAHRKIAAVNMLTPLALLRHFGEKMVGRRRGGIILMSSVAGFQGAGYLATYASTKTFLKTLAESLWYEWHPCNVDVIACCAGATATPNYHATNPGKASPLEPRPQQPQQVVAECLRRIGTTPSFVSGAANKFVTFMMQHLITKKTAIRMFSKALKKMYRLTLIPVLLFSHACHTSNKENKNDTDTVVPYLNPDLPIDQRVSDLVNRMTLDEKIGQMMNAAPAIPRLHIAAYNWWNESLHGVARAGLATVYPQAIGLAAAWDEDMQYKMATAISDEARAKYNDFIRQDKHDIYEGLTFFSPNINIFRDPRWGRGQETYGEDPFLTGRLAVRFIKGLQGDDPKYFKTIATVKHFAVHSGPESERHFFDARPDERDFRETYLPQFEMGIREGKAFSVMCAYNRLYGQACCGSSRLLTTILRNEWGFSGYVVSDCGAIDDIYERHKIVSTPDSAAVLAVKSGCDLECMNTYAHLKEAVANKIITGQEIDVSVKRLFTARMKLGMFDPADSVKYNRIPFSVVDDKEHRQLALETARKSIVLLRNAQNLLPLRKDLHTIAVIGPNADDSALLLGNYNGTPSYTITPLRGIRAKLGTSTAVLYTKGCELAGAMPHPVSASKMRDTALRIARQADAVILCMGLSPRLEGEELKLILPGFAGGDRTTLDLPKEQEDLIHAIAATGKPVILVLLNGSAVSINWEDQHLPAIVEAWYPGQAGGTAIADVLFGDYNPAGRLPVTFYTSVKDLPNFGDYAMAGRTYRYFNHPVLYPFGYGLSYTTFHYYNLRIDKAVGPGDSLLLSVQVNNTGPVEGDEVAQIYISALDTPRTPKPREDALPIRSLRAFRRIHLQPGQIMTLHFAVAPDAFTIIDDKMQRVPLYGRYAISAGGGQPDSTRAASSNTLTITAAIPNKAS